jgi:hypothetical protein
MAVNNEVGKTGAVACVEKLGGGCDSEEDCSRRSTVVRATPGIHDDDRSAVAFWFFFWMRR